MYERRTTDLVLGDRLRPLKAMHCNDTLCVARAVAQGFVFGDGARGKGGRPATLDIYSTEKHFMLRYFAQSVQNNLVSETHGEYTHIYGLPRFWKQLPPIRESRSYLLSWLAGYFAADGSMTEAGQATIESSVRGDIEFVRDIAAICGVGYGRISTKMRRGFLKEPSEGYRISLAIRDLPQWFFMLPHHKDRATQRIRKKAHKRTWRIISVEKTDRMEEVFCATVPGAGAFALADSLMTGNCPFSGGKEEHIDRLAQLPDKAVHAMMIEHASVCLNPRQNLYNSGKSLRTVFIEQGHLSVVEQFDRRLTQIPWRIAHIRRYWKGTQNTARSLKLSKGWMKFPEATKALAHIERRMEGTLERDANGITRVFIKKRTPKLYPDTEEMYAMVPAFVDAKTRKNFDTHYTAVRTSCAKTKETKDG